MTASERLFHFVLPGDWTAFVEAGGRLFSPASLAREGFVHLSLAEQLHGTLVAHFGTRSRMLLVEVWLDADESALKFEPSRDGALFPHLYRALQFDELARVWELSRSNEDWLLPRLGATPELDAPRGATPTRLGEVD